MACVEAEGVQVECDRCGCESGFITSNDAHARFLARDYGWETRGGEDLCRECAYKKEATND